MAVTYKRKNSGRNVMYGNRRWKWDLPRFPIEISAGFMLVFFTIVLSASSKLPTHTGPLLLQLKD